MVQHDPPVKREPVSVVAVDDHGLFVRGLELLLGAASEGRVSVVAATSDPAEAEALVSRHRPDVLLVDLSMPSLPGERVIAAAKRAVPGLRALILSGSDDLDRITAALRDGADGFVPKTSDPAELLGPILSVAAGWSVVPGAVLDQVARPAGPALELGDRDLWLLRRIATGAEVKQLASELHVSERTAKRMLAALLQHLGVDTRIEAAALAGRLGLLEHPAAPTAPPPD